MGRRSSLGLAALVLWLSCQVPVGNRADEQEEEGGGDTDAGTASCDELGVLGEPVTDLSGLEACCRDQGSWGRCVPEAEIPDDIEPRLAGCSGGGVCVPDDVLAAGGSAPPRCTATSGPGRCLSPCLPLVAENAELLSAAGCDEGLLCVPCQSPLDGTSTGACELAAGLTCEAGDDGGGGADTPPPPPCDDPSTCEYDAECPPLIDPANLTPCADDAHCVSAETIDAAAPGLAEAFATCETDPSRVCVPDVVLETGGKYTPASCVSINDAEGRCLSTALPDVGPAADQLPQSTCAASERCVPCYDPVTGEWTEACAVGCDPGPVEPPRTYASCCEGRARCIPNEQIDPEQAELLEDDDDDCDDIVDEAFHCVPVEPLQGGPFPPCAAESGILGAYTGVCLSKCFDWGIERLAFDEGPCGDDYYCVPCEDDGEPTGAPGCGN